MTTLTIFGVLLILFALVMIIIYPTLNAEKMPKFLMFFDRAKSRIVLLIGIALFMLNGLFFYAMPGTAYAVQYLWGGDEAIFSQGIKLKLWGRTIPMSYEIPIQDVILYKDQELPQEKTIYHRRASQWEFADAIKAHIATAVIVGIDVGNNEVFLNMADRNQSENNLVYSRIMPNISAAIKNTCKLLDAQDYIAGASAQFDQYFRDQLENGMYQTEPYFEVDEKPEIIGDSLTIRTVTNKQSTKQKKYRIKRANNGDILRDNSNSLKQYGLRILQAQVTSIDWENSFDKRLDLQKDQVAQTQLEKQEAEKEIYRTQKEIAKGEAEKAKERARLEKEQIQQTIEAETRAKVAKFKVLEEKNLLEAARNTAARVKVESDAEALKNKRLVQAGLTPQERAEWEYKTSIGVAEHISSLQLPQVYISGQDGKKGSSSILEELLGAEFAKKMLNTK
ncbi:MAG: hypothetical protein CL840_14185 [Crocinitomicaceae bacterium]|nr:hypothetical protein [Crocinitomicaceae bacterium]|tara:strand:- start:84 stop:1433 length:1350 start_codon:yes stop_codon:yes gene_type:complete